MKDKKMLQWEVAKQNPYNSVNEVCLTMPIDNKKYVGVKDVPMIPYSLIQKLENTEEFVLHTKDRSAWGGRAIDLHLINPITGNYMTGSSSGTAVNVFTHINDLGIGGDGGGSVLAPAMSLNLFGFISPLIEEEHVLKFSKASTDGIVFTPSIGYMTREFDLLEKTIHLTLDLPNKQSNGRIVISETDDRNYLFETEKIKFEDIYGSRNTLIKFLLKELPNCDFLISYEGPIDVNGFGDSVFGHFDETCAQIQRKACKGLLRVANMVNATAITIPDKSLACGWVCICESKPEKIARMLEVVKTLIQPRSELIERYFSNLEMYNPIGFNDKGE